MDDDDPNGGGWRRRSPVRDNVGMINIALWEGITPPQAEHQEIAPWRQRCQSPPRESLGRAGPKQDLGLEEDQYLSHNFGDYFTIAVWSKHMRQEVLPVVASTPIEESSDVALKTSVRGREEETLAVLTELLHQGAQAVLAVSVPPHVDIGEVLNLQPQQSRQRAALVISNY
ncbi:hypothetical protein NE237_010966 [Protea cynaroides]|uniref:Uncharacterized protein n=1 Tax=Protea cynaroides TaxID=273540 RepID=A0A9Q0L0R2_9MAGN|nr:hypothetical protein NE237_010966 [Protea cynaroides]